jgi:hypothetical protein
MSMFLCHAQAEFRKKAEDVSVGLKSLRQRNADAQQLRSFIADRCAATSHNPADCITANTISQRLSCRYRAHCSR